LYLFITVEYLFAYKKITDNVNVGDIVLILGIVNIMFLKFFWISIILSCMDLIAQLQNALKVTCTLLSDFQTVLTLK